MKITQFFRILWIRRNIILVTTLSALAAALLVVSLLPPRYTATSRVMMEIVKPDPVTGQAMSAGGLRTFVATQIELIKDYQVAGRVVDQLNWTASPELAEAYRNADAGDMSFRRWLAQRVMDTTDANLVSGSNVLEISYTADRPETAATIADAIRDAYIHETRLAKKGTAQGTADWFKNQTAKLQAQLREAEAKKTAFEKANDVVVNSDLSDNETARLAALAGMTDVQAPVVSGGGAPVIAPSQGQLAQIDAGIESAMRTLGPNHPRLVALRQQRAAVAATVQQELSAARSAARTSVGPTGPSASALYAAQQAKVLAKRDKIAEAQQLAIDVSVLREQLQKASTRAAELQQQAESEDTGLTLLGNAVAPSSPTFPKIPLTIFGALALGLLLGTGTAVLLELLYRKVRGPYDLMFDGIPLIGMATSEIAVQKRPSLVDRARRLLPHRGEATA